MACQHFKSIKTFQQPEARVCEDCIKIGGRWVHLRMCLTCGHVACCDSSPNRHATAHFHQANHPVIRSVEPSEVWAYCYVDDVARDDLGLEPAVWEPEEGVHFG